MKITINNVWKNQTKELTDEIVTFWNNHKAIPPNVDIYDRAKQVVIVVRNEKTEIIGVTTSYLTTYSQLKNNVFVFRGMISPSYRIPGLFIKMTIESLQILEEFSSSMNESARPIGVIAEMENANLRKARITKLASGMTLLGFSQKENPVYVRYFKGAKF